MGRMRRGYAPGGNRHFPSRVALLAQIDMRRVCAGYIRRAPENTGRRAGYLRRVPGICAGRLAEQGYAPGYAPYIYILESTAAFGGLDSFRFLSLGLGPCASRPARLF